jgi:hypothetical protein
MRYRFSLLSLSLSLSLLPASVFAAQVTVLPEQKSVIANAEFITEVTINTGDESINAFSGTLVFPKGVVEVKEVRTANSIVNYWVETPERKENTITFSGMTPGGYAGSNGLLFSVVFTAAEQGKGTISVKDPLFLKNDGFGTAAKIAVSNSVIEVLAPDVRRNIVIPPLQDTTPPEPFTPEISRSNALYKRAWLLFFIAQDKGSGIDHYEIQESAGGLFNFFTPWKRAESPYVLQDQSLRTGVNVRAIDKAGNIRTAHVPALHPPAWYANLTNWFILASIIVILITVKEIVWRKR